MQFDAEIDAAVQVEVADITHSINRRGEVARCGNRRRRTEQAVAIVQCDVDDTDAGSTERHIHVSVTIEIGQHQRTDTGRLRISRRDEAECAGCRLVEQHGEMAGAAGR